MILARISRPVLGSILVQIPDSRNKRDEFRVLMTQSPQRPVDAARTVTGRNTWVKPERVLPV